MLELGKMHLYSPIGFIIGSINGNIFSKESEGISLLFKLKKIQ